MKELVIPFHSFVDVITNSSTTVYVRASESSIKALKDFINGILKAGGSKEKADDLFEFEIKMGDSEIERCVEKYWNEVEEKDSTAVIPKYDKQRAEFEKLVKAGTIKAEDYTDDYDEYPKSNALIMRSKVDTKQTQDIISTFENMFAIDGYRDG